MLSETALQEKIARHVRTALAQWLEQRTAEGPDHVWQDGKARDDQTPPLHDRWTTWLLLGGRGAGKTRAGAEWIRQFVGGGRLRRVGENAPRVALVAEAYADAREVMIEGPSGLMSIGDPKWRPSFESSRRRLEWPNGAIGYCFSAEDPEGLRGHQFDAAWSDELGKWRYADETWSNLQLGLRLGARPRQVVTTTPRPTGLLKRLITAPSTHVSRASTYANRDNLAEAFFTEIAAIYEGTALGRQELLGELIEETAGALWTWPMVEAARITRAPALERIVVAVDPPATSGPDADECGIIVAGSWGETGYVLADRSAGGLSPQAWASRVVSAYHEFEADRIVVEVNQGGDMVRAIVAQVDPSVAIRQVRARHGKRLRAEPVAALYERGLVRHQGSFPELEDQMTSFTGRRPGGKSPDRLDALVWAITDLLLTRPAGRPSVRVAS